MSSKGSDSHPYHATGAVDKKGTVKQTSSKSVSQVRGLCEGCGIRTHTIAAFNQKVAVKNDDVYYGVCIKCNPGDVVPAVRKAWEERQNSGNQKLMEQSKSTNSSRVTGENKSSSSRSSGVRENKSSSSGSSDVRSDNPANARKIADLAKAPSKPGLADKIIDKERKEGFEKQGLCPDCGIRTHKISRFNREPLKNGDVHYGICIKCNPDDVLPAVRKAWEEKQNSGGPSKNSSNDFEELKTNSAHSPPKEASRQNIVSPQTPSKSRMADNTVKQGRREDLEKQGLCPDCGIRTHKISRFNREPLKNGEVHYGVCIKCNPNDVLPSVRKAWEDKLKSSRYLEVEGEEEDDESEESPPVVPEKETPVEQKNNMAPASANVLSDEKPELWPREDTPVSLGWIPEERHVFHHVIPFCSSFRRSKEEKQEDNYTFGGINRCVFSNLFVDDEDLHVTPGAEFMGHASQFSEGLCAESFYMAAKCKLECDARFIMNDLKKSAHIERFCHNRFELSLAQKQLLVDYGADPADFRRADASGEREPTDPDSRWFRWAGGKMPIRRDWYAVRHQVVLYILRHKFGGDRGYVTQKTMRALCALICDDGELPLIVEHRKKDGFWGDAQNGSGYSILGKTITQVLLEITGVAATAPFLSRSQASRQLFHPNTEIVDYEYPESESESEESIEALNENSGHSGSVVYDLKSGKPLRRVSETEGSGGVESGKVLL